MFCAFACRDYKITSTAQDGETDDWESEKNSRKFQRTSGPHAKDPYTSDDSWFMPITMAIALFLPILFCLCRH